MIRHCYDAQLLVGFVMEVTEEHHIVLCRNLYARSVPIVVPELRCAGNCGENSGVCSDDIT